MQSLRLESSTHSSPAEAVANLDDLLKQILVRVEAESLVRYKCVSKHWLSLISDPKFRDDHTLQNPNPQVSAFFFRSTKKDLSFISLHNNENPSGSRSKPLDFIPQPRHIKILQSCNGLLLCCSGEKQTTPRRYFIVNPTTSQFSTLPSPQYAGYRFDDILGIALAFDPSKTLHYKVVAVWTTSRYTIGIAIYSSETRSWSPGLNEVDLIQGQFEVDFSHGVYCNGSIHWLNHKDELFYHNIDYDSDQNDSDEMPVRLLPRPVRLVYDREYRYFGESSGHLHLIDIFRPCITQFDVLELKRDHSGWFLKYRVDLDPIIKTYRPCIARSDEMLIPSDYSGWFVKYKADLHPTNYSFLEVVECSLDQYYSFVVLSLTGEENGGDPCLLLYFPSKVISYNLRDKTSKKLCDLASNGAAAETDGSSQVQWLEAYHHMGTLARV